MNFYKHYIGDFQRDTSHLSLTERGAYLALMHHYYATETPLPADAASLCRIAGAITPVEQKAVKAVMTFFERSDSGLIHNRIEAELEKAGTRADKNREIAVAREAKRRAQREARTEHEQSTKRARTVAETCNEQSTNSEPIPDTRHQRARTKAASATPDDFRAGLFARWKALPDAGGGAFLSKLIRDHGPEQRVLEAVERTLDEARADPKAFVLGILRREARQVSDHDLLMARVQ